MQYTTAVSHYSPTSPDRPLDYRIVAALSLLLSVWLIAIDPILTRDAIIYLRTADAYLQEGFFASQQLFGRPLLSLCMALVHQLTGLPLVYAGLLVNSLFYALLCCAFVATVRSLGGNRQVQIFAAWVILTHPLIGSYRSSIMRDPAFWALMMLAFRELLLYARNPTLRNEIAWFACIIGATLFRFEGLFFAILAPWALLFAGPRSGRLNKFLRLLLPQLVAVGAMAAGVFTYQRVIEPGARLFPAIEKYVAELRGIATHFEQLTAETGQVLLEFTARDDATTAAVAGLLAVLALNIFRAISWPWVATLLWGWWRGYTRRLAPVDMSLLNAHLMISLLYLSLFMLMRQFMLERYSGIFALFALLYLPFVLSALWQGRGWRAGRVAVVILLLASTGDILHNHNYQKWYIRDATEWIRDNTPESASLITNDRFIAYFSKRQVDWGKGKPRNYKFDVARLAREPQLWRNYDYLVVNVRRGEREAWQLFLDQYSLSEEAGFEGQRGGRISIVRPRQKTYPKASRSSAKHSPTSAFVSAS